MGGGSVFDRIRSDFTSGKRERCVQIKPQCVDRDQAEAWEDFFDKIREGVLISFSQVKKTTLYVDLTTSL